MEKHPLLVNVIIRRILQYLPLKDVKQCRLVCREWDSEAFPLLNRRSSINLNRESEIQDFLKYANSEIKEPRQFKSYRLFDVKFSQVIHTSEVQCLFDTCGNNIHNLTLRNIFLADESDKLIKVCDISQWISPLVDHLVELDIGGSCSIHYTTFSLPLGQLCSLKAISIHHCIVTIDSLEKRIAPTKLALDNCQFYQKGQKLTETCLNDIINFSKCQEIILRSPEDNWTFDISKDLINAQKFQFYGGKIINWETSEAKIRSVKLKMRTQLLAKSKIVYKHFEFERYFDISVYNIPVHILDLSVLSKATEKLAFTSISHTFHPYKIDLPNLKSLKIYIVPTAPPTTVGELKILDRFSICSNLSNIELLYYSKFAVINLHWFPRSVRRLCITNGRFIQFITENGEDLIEDDSSDYIELEKLVLHCALEEAGKVLQKLRPNILVLFATVSPKNNDIISFVRKNLHLEKIIIKIVSYDYDSKEIPFTSTHFSQFVDKKSDYYEFSKQNFGKSISEREFYTYHYHDFGF